MAAYGRGFPKGKPSNTMATTRPLLLACCMAPAQWRLSATGGVVTLYRVQVGLTRYPPPGLQERGEWRMRSEGSGGMGILFM